MKKYLLLLIGIFIFSFFVKIPNYVELNNLIIIEGIGVSCEENNVTLYLKEIIPEKKDNGITYNYKLYEESAKNIKSAFLNLEKKNKKKIYFKEAKYIITNCTKSNKIIEYFEINPRYIKHTKQNIKKELES